ncbi:hypothetical protein G7Y89_g12434 [Cudoniella acicularis]|uniref:Uncharacterized protein n=1 Tax=Cudoniella acicularis TaxID=354080 RepID=A0A8H4R8U5_9HELO|nr:hypothetical protein G7Y89_g12434 [Cudoniella acicularis]
MKPKALEDRSDAEGNSPVHLVFKIVQRLTDYPQFFERHPCFKDDMAPDYVDSVKKFPEEPFWSQEIVEMEGHLRPPNPFRGREPHCVENALWIAVRYSTAEDPKDFYELRVIVLRRLEPQYQRVAAAASRAAKLIKAAKRPSEVLDTENTGRCPRNCLVELMIVAEDYANAFYRDLAPETRVAFRGMQRQIQIFYSTLTREMLLKKMSGWLEEAREMNDTLARSWRRSFLDMFREVIDDMDE